METEITRQYNQYSDAVYRYIFLLVRQKETAEDLTQDTFYKAFRSMGSYRREAAELTWLMRIARNVTYDHFRRKRIIAFFPFDDQKDNRKSEENPENVICLRAMNRSKFLYLGMVRQKNLI